MHVESYFIHGYCRDISTCKYVLRFDNKPKKHYKLANQVVIQSNDPWPCFALCIFVYPFLVEDMSFFRFQRLNSCCLWCKLCCKLFFRCCYNPYHIFFVLWIRGPVYFIFVLKILCTYFHVAIYLNSGCFR